VSTSDPVPEPREPLPCVVANLGRLMEHRLNTSLSEYGLTGTQFIALTHIAHHPHISRNGLARGLHVAPQAAGGLISQLLSKDFVDRSSSPPGHPSAVALTEDGHRVLRRAAPSAQRLTDDLIASARPRLAPLMDEELRYLLGRLS
jgi:DNA-binding MarR family transcriptional regulator